jgi:hypothetical protein
VTASPHVEADTLGPELTPEQERTGLESEVQRNFGIALTEFERRWRAGEYQDNDDPRVTSVGMLLR